MQPMRQDRDEDRKGQWQGKDLQTLPVARQLCALDAPLSTDERALFQECEAVIAAGLKSFFEVGQALATIREGRLYRHGHSTFEAYCKTRWNISRFYGYRLINAAGVMGRLLPIGNIPLPGCESQVRKLSRVPPERQGEAWRMAVELARGAEVAACHVERALVRLGYSCRRAGGADELPEDAASLKRVAQQERRVLGKRMRREEWRASMQSLKRLRQVLERLAGA